MPVIDFDGQLFRISKASRGVDGVIYFGRNKTERFDDPDGKFGVCYAGLDEHAAFIEVFGQSLQVILDADLIYERALAMLELSRKVSVVDITGVGAAWIGEAGEVSSGAHGISQKWSKALYVHPRKPDGILYRCRHDQDRLSLALFDREPNMLKVASYLEWSDPVMKRRLGELLDHYRMGISSS